MVTILPPKTNLGSQIGQSFGEGYSKSYEEKYKRGQLKKGLDDLRSQAQNSNATPTDLLYNLIEASGYSPEIGRNLPQLYAELNKAREAAAMKEVNYAGEESQEMRPGGISSSSRPMTNQVEQSISGSQFFPKNIGPRESPGNAPQEATSGQVRPVLSGDELLQKAQQRQAELAKHGIVKPFEDVFNQVSTENEHNRVYNQHVENERVKRIEAQEQYGTLAETKLTNLLPGASDEEKSIFRKMGEEVSTQGKSQGDINRYLTREAEKYKNTLSNIEKNLEAPRIQNKLQRSFLGKGTDIKNVEQDAKAAIKPLLDLGLYEKARTMLANAGFYPEEREMIIFGEMPKDLKQFIDKVPKARYDTKVDSNFNLKKLLTPPKEIDYDMKSKLDLYESLSNIWSKGENDQVNLLQLRKAYEDRGYDWRIFKDSMNELVNNGYIKLNPDQMNTFNSYLNDPPLNNLEKILHGLGLRGR